MSKRLYELFFFDIYIAILKIENITKRYNNPQELLYDFTSWDSVIREFSIIGEATNQLIRVKILDEKNRKIVDFRNVLIHEYFGIDQDEVWLLATKYLTPFKKYILRYITDMDKDKKNLIIDELIEENNYLRFITDDLKQLKENK